MYKQMIMIGTILILNGCTSNLADKLATAAMDGLKAGLEVNSNDIGNRSFEETPKEVVKEAKSSTPLTSNVKKSKTPKFETEYDTIENCIRDNKWRLMSMVTLGEICEESTKKTESSQSKLSQEERKKLNDCIQSYPSGQFFAEDMCAEKLGLKLSKKPSQFGFKKHETILK